MPRVPFRRWLPVLLASLFVLTGASTAQAHFGSGAVYTETNAATGNAVQKFDRAADGTLSLAGTYPTGGNGSSTPGGRQGAVALSGDERTVYAVNAGSDSVTAFAVTPRGLISLGSAPSGGIAPVSVAVRGNRVYVLNSGDDPSRGAANVATFIALPFGRLVPLPGGTEDLSTGAAGAAQVSVAPDGRRLLVTERVSNRLETLPLDRLGRPAAPVVTASSGATPFGFGFDRRGTAIVSEAGASTVSSYRIGAFGGLEPVTAALSVGQGAACWVAVSPDGRYAYTGNGTGSISGFAVARDGALTALTPGGITAALPAPFTPRDLAFSRDGRYLYAVSPGGQVIGFRAGRDGSLTPNGSVPAAAGITGAAAA
jgi:6-phosphogluconolactonase (cycloisomerase 2 family)